LEHTGVHPDRHRAGQNRKGGKEHEQPDQYSPPPAPPIPSALPALAFGLLEGDPQTLVLVERVLQGERRGLGGAVRSALFRPQRLTLARCGAVSGLIRLHEPSSFLFAASNSS